MKTSLELKNIEAIREAAMNLMLELNRAGLDLSDGDHYETAKLARVVEWFLMKTNPERSK